MQIISNVHGRGYSESAYRIWLSDTTMVLNSSTVMYKVFLSYIQLKNYPGILTEMDLLSYDEDIKTFKTTEKGLRSLNTYCLIDDAMKIIPSRG